MSIKEYIDKNGWVFEKVSDAALLLKKRIADVKMVVNVSFLNTKKKDDEVQFDISPYDVDELSDLFSAFCKEIGGNENSVQDIYVVDFIESEAV